jgi:protein-disulfide isomerase
MRLSMPFAARIAALALAGALLTGPVRAEDPAAGAFTDAPVMVPETPAEGALSSPFTGAEREALHAEIRSYLLANPGLLMEMLQLLEQEKQANEALNDQELVADNRDAIFDDGFSWVGGNPDGSVTIVEFLDYQCGYCRKAQPEVNELIAEDGDIRLVVKEMPILGPGSELAARAAVATLIADGPEAYGRLHDRLMRTTGKIDDALLDKVLVETGLDPVAVRVAMEDPEVERRLAETLALAGKLAIAGTPTFVFGDRMVRGYVPLDTMTALVGEARAAD